MSGRRGRKRAVAKQEEPSVDANYDINLKPTLTAVAPAPPASPLVTLAAQAISPIVAAARAVSSAAAAALPTIPETQAATAAQALDVDPDLHLDTTPRSPTSPTAMHNPFTGPATVKQTRSRTVSFAVENTVLQEQQDDNVDDSQQHPEKPQVQDNEPGSAVHKLKSKSLMIDLTSCLAANGSHIFYTVALLFLLILVHCQKSVLSRQQSYVLQQQEQVRAQAAALDSLQQQLQHTRQQLQDLPDQEQLKTVAATCSAHLQDFNATQVLLNSSMGQLKAISEQLAANVTAVSESAKAGQQAWQVLSAAVAADQVTHNHTAAAAEHPALSNSSSPTAASANRLRLQQELFLQSRSEQQIISQHLQESKEVLASMPSKVRQEVQQQLAAKLPPLDVALADCGAHVLFHTAINRQRFFQDRLSGAHTGSGWTSCGATTFPSSTSASLCDGSQPYAAHMCSVGMSSNADAPTAAAQGALPPESYSSSTLQKLHTFIATQLQRLLHTPTKPSAHTTAAGSSSAEWQQQLQEQAMSLQHINRLLLTPAGAAAGRCLPFMLLGGVPAVLEIALPQLTRVHSVTLHYPMPPAPLQDHEQATAWFSRAPAHATVALVNSSSCSSMAAGANSNMADGHPSLCSTAGINSKSFSSNTTESNTSSLDKSGAQQEGATAATDSTIVPSEVTDTYERGAGKVTGSGSSPAAFVVEGAASIQQELHLTADSLKFGNGRAVMQIKQAQGAKGEVAGNVETGVLADRIVLKISSSVGGAGDDVCLQRISVQGVPSDLAAFC